MFSDLNKIWLRFGYVQATTTTYDEGKIKARVTVKSNIECWSDKEHELQSLVTKLNVLH